MLIVAQRHVDDQTPACTLSSNVASETIAEMAPRDTHVAMLKVSDREQILPV